MLYALIIIFCCQLIGEVISRTTGLPLLGPVIGMALLLAGLVSIKRLRDLIGPTARGILGYMSMLFVPAGVGVVGHLGVIGHQAFPIVAAVVGSTILALIAGAIAFTLTARLTGVTAAPEDRKNG